MSGSRTNCIVSHCLLSCSVLQLLVEEMRIDAVERRCRVKNEELEALAPAVKATLTNIARLRGEP